MFPPVVVTFITISFVHVTTRTLVLWWCKLVLSSAATLDGGLGCLVPIPEKVYRRMIMLQLKMNSGLSHLAGLNPKAFRKFRTHHQYLYNPRKNILDGNLLSQYLQLSVKQKTDFAKQIGTSPRQVLDTLKEIDKITTHF